MSRLQETLILNEPYDREHLEYKITIPKNVSAHFKLKCGQTVYIKDDNKTIYIHMNYQVNSIPIIVSKNLTRIYTNIQNIQRKYYTTRLCIPIEIVKNCKLQKQDKFYFNQSKDIITMHKIPTPKQALNKKQS